MGYNTHLSEQESPSQCMSGNQCLLRHGQVSVWVGILGDQLLGPVVYLTDQQVYCTIVFGEYLLILLAHGSCMMGHHRIFFALSDIT
jgi:hypothetical protein